MNPPANHPTDNNFNIDAGAQKKSKQSMNSLIQIEDDTEIMVDLTTSTKKPQTAATRTKCHDHRRRKQTGADDRNHARLGLEEEVAKKRERELGHPQPDTWEEEKETMQAPLVTGMENWSKDEKRINNNENNDQKTGNLNQTTKTKPQKFKVKQIQYNQTNRNLNNTKKDEMDTERTKTQEREKNMKKGTKKQQQEKGWRKTATNGHPLCPLGTKPWKK
jgi:hypothetical protein